ECNRHEHLFAKITDILLKRRCDVGGLQAFQRRPVGRRDHRDRALHALGTEIAFKELADFTAAFADQREHDDIGFCVAHDLAEQRALAAAGSREDSEALAFSAGEQTIDGAQPQADRPRDELTRHRSRWLRIDGVVRGRGEWTAIIERPAEAVDYTSQQRRANRYAVHLTQWHHLGRGRGAGEFTKWGEQGEPVGHAHHLRKQLLAVPAVAQRTEFTNACAGRVGLHDGAGDLLDTPAKFERLGEPDAFGEPCGKGVAVTQGRHLIALMSAFSMARSWVSTEASITPSSVSSTQPSSGRRGSDSMSRNRIRGNSESNAFTRACNASRSAGGTLIRTWFSWRSSSRA